MATGACPAQFEVQWERSKEVKSYHGDELYRYINGAAEFYLKNGFVRAQIKSYTSRHFDDPIVVEIYEMDSVKNTRAVYRKYDRPTAEKLSLGDEARAYRGLVEARKNVFFVRVYTSNKLTDEKKVLADIAKSTLNGLSPNPPQPRRQSP
ncbi:MAG: hypothetical protein RDV48_03185 [Candidatus Eremiobacteraeota bacterium]|nr:hypothetical protein [Candidatus Eremiobacteraeota bacterium]